MSHRSSSRREFLGKAGIAATGGWLATSLAAADTSQAVGNAPVSPRPDEALRLLLEGNERFATGRPINPRRSPADFQSLAEGQSPFAVIVGCADSRVAPEILFTEAAKPR